MPIQKTLTLTLPKTTDIQTRFWELLGCIKSSKPDVIVIKEEQISPNFSAFEQTKRLYASLEKYQYSISKITENNSKTWGFSILAKRPITHPFEYYQNLNNNFYA